MKKNIFLGLGGNVGDVKTAMQESIALLQKQNIEIVAVSRLYHTPPWGLETQDWFLNCCLHGKTKLLPQQLLSACQKIELIKKRTREIKWGPRTIDIDILFYENFNSTTSDLHIPHPRIAERAFVLLPLAEIAPQLKLNGNSIAWLAEKITKKIAKKNNCQNIKIADENKNWWH